MNSIIPYYGDSVCFFNTLPNTSSFGATEIVNLTTLAKTEYPGTTSIMSSGAFDGNTWIVVAKGVPGNQTGTVVYSGSPLQDAMGLTNPQYSQSSAEITIPRKVVWTGTNFYVYGTNGTSSPTINMLASTTGTSTWGAVTANSIPIEIRDMCFTPNKITVSSGNNYTRYFASSNTVFSGSLTTNDCIFVKNISAQPIEVFGSPGINSAELQIPPGSAIYAYTRESIVYSDGSYLVVV